ncbi:MAG: ABC transporter ATP-binding protein, partial [Rhizobiaceae bacterium]|nr:ABC transporter ATP-binding protein [Rhizobiaceae bacterium]
FALESLPAKIAEAEKAIAALEAKLADPTVFSRDPATFNKTAAELEKARVQVAAMEEEWLELEMLREEMEG